MSTMAPSASAVSLIAGYLEVHGQLAFQPIKQLACRLRRVSAGAAVVDLSGAAAGSQPGTRAIAGLALVILRACSPMGLLPLSMAVFSFLRRSNA
jgi:hypothetical protein